ncbi:contact-dependent growth inhibition system immunity protein [Pseudomonas cerasi]
MFSLLSRLWDKNKYPVMQEILTIYFDRNHDDFGSSIDEIACYYSDCNVLSRPEARKEIYSLLKIPDDNELKVILDSLSADGFRPEPWGETWRSFLEKILKQLER